ncbi:uncharacterized protein F4822DRAFT_407513 [Hypoxylon trugodes]|uniref:uncharacterized protein n=1 Tax=Hypoxylon trugodes TaxID=326681 RepID=UPI00219E993C|nr:uncharacterized protein F4822DRAFT_407513 [Hypoxylon trugodes]KAI1387762.1 hypothetical protein F4822DRAFT_407513 [Hypoxylon trugodes]
MESIGSLRISDDVPSLTSLPTDILYIILTYLDTAGSVAHLGATCKGLHRLISESGWRIFITSRFNTFKLSEVSSTDEWRARARSLTTQSRDWDRRALAIDVLKPPSKHRTWGPDPLSTWQSIPSNILVDAYHQHKGNDAQDIIFWGAGEDVFGLLRHNRGPKPPTDEWLCGRGAASGYHSGRDDVTSVSILKGDKCKYGQGDEPQVLVGRASGQLHLLSMGTDDFGNTLLSFKGSNRPDQPNNEAIRQTDIQSLDVNYKQGVLAAATKQSILMYPLVKDRQTVHNDPAINNSEEGSSPYVWADEALSLKDDRGGPGTFEFIRTVKFVNEDTLAVGLNKGYNPLQYLKNTPTGIEISYAAKSSSQTNGVDEYKFETIRSILPVDTRSVASGGGNSVLSSWADGTIRLQDLRSPSPTDRIFQDNFDLSTPINALLSHGLERFVAGSAYSPVLKVFDYRWPKGYYHTEGLPCGNDAPYPTPRPPVPVLKPYFSDNRATCDHISGRRCRWHALSRQDFSRPNFNMWLPTSYSPTSDTSPVYSLASPSDDSPTLFVGLSGSLVEITTKSERTRRPIVTTTQPAKDLVYSRKTESVAFIETGLGFALEDYTLSQRVPIMHRQLFGGAAERNRPKFAEWRRRHRLDEWLQGSSYEV